MERLAEEGSAHFSGCTVYSVHALVGALCTLHVLVGALCTLQVIVDPGVGFAKTVEGNFELIRCGRVLGMHECTEPTASDACAVPVSVIAHPATWYIEQLCERGQ